MEEKKKKKSQEELEELQRKQEQDLERAAILMKADEIKEETFDFDVNGQIELKNELADMVLEQIDDPEAKYNLYYNVVNRLLRKYLPKGDTYKDASIIRKSKFSPNSKRSVHFSRVHSKRNVQKKDLHATRTTKPEIRAKITLFRAWALSSTIQQAI